MVFRVPSHFDSFVPSHAPQTGEADRQFRPWRGRIIVSGLRTSDRSSQDRIQVTSVETDGDNRVEAWPHDFYAQILFNRPILQEVLQYLQVTKIPTCNFLPQRLVQQDQHDSNLASFRALSRMLVHHRTVAIAQWPSGGELSYQGDGIIIYPAPNASTYLIAAVFHSQHFPDFVRGTVAIPQAVPMGQYQQLPMGQGSSSYAPQQYRQTHSGSPHRSNPNSPIEQPSSSGSYRYIVPRSATLPSAGSTSYPSQTSGSPSSATRPTEGAYPFPPPNPPFP